MNPRDFSIISFPFLGLEMDLPRGIPFDAPRIYFYGIIIAVGLILAVVYGSRRSRQFGLNEDTVLDGVLWVTPFAILCARLYYCAFSWDIYRDNPISLLYIWEGGLAIYGGVIGAAIGIIVYTRIKKLNLGALLDLVSLGFLIGQSIGRWGNFFNEEAHGGPTDLPWAQIIDGVGYHPTFLYESLWCLMLCIFLLWFDNHHRKFDGQIICLYAMLYSVERFFVEALRTDSLMIGPFKQAQVLSLTLIIICTVVDGVLARHSRK